MTSWARDDLRRLLEDDIPFNRHLGVRVLEAGPERARLALPFRPEFVGDPERPALHGGVISMLIDTAGGLAALAAIARSDRLATVDLVVDYLQPAPPADLVATARVVRRGNRVCLVTVEVTRADGEGGLIAQGRGVYNISPAKRG